jgi:predicted Rossmann fold flavoprotein
MMEKMNEKGKKTVAIIGGGAAGMMATAAVLEEAALSGDGAGGIEAVVFEKNDRMGRKVSISGGGRCNVTTGIPDARKVLENYPRGAKFLMSAMFRFPPAAVMEWFEERGVTLKTEDDLRVFPVSGEGADVVDAAIRHLRSLGAIIRYHSAIDGVEKKGDKFLLTMKSGSQDEGSGAFEADALIITTGGSAYAQTGSAGDGYEFAKALGHTVTKMVPSLGGLTVSEDFMGELAGVSVEKAGLELFGVGTSETGSDKERVISYKRTGPFVFTHKGLSGPAVFALQSMAAYETFSQTRPLKLQVDFFPDENAETLRKHLQKAIEQNGKKSVRNLLDFFLPKSLCGAVVQSCGIPANEGCGNLSREQRDKLTAALKGFTLHVTGTCAGEEFVTAGGVSLKEIDSSTMESKICPGLYFAGEILDVDGFTGGFNLQAAWATGRLAGESAAVKMIKGPR